MLLTVARVCECVWQRKRERERERERDRVTSQHISYLNRGLCVCVCVWVWERERERDGHITVECTAVRYRLNHGLFANTYEHHVSVTRLCSPLWLELMLKLRTLLTVFTFILKAEAGDYRKRRYISDAACGVRPITMHCASWPIRADCACRKEGLCRKRLVWERRGIGRR